MFLVCRLQNNHFLSRCVKTSRCGHQLAITCSPELLSSAGFVAQPVWCFFQRSSHLPADKAAHGDGGWFLLGYFRLRKNISWQQGRRVRYQNSQIVDVLRSGLCPVALCLLAVSRLAPRFNP